MESRLALETLDAEECWSRLRSRRVGRISITLGALPVILPVFYAVLDQSVVFTTDPSSRLAAATDGAVVAFEADDYRDESDEGWSVLIQGVAEPITEPDELAMLGGLGLRSIGSEQPPRYVAVPGTTINGRSVRSAAPVDTVTIAPTANERTA